MTDRVALVLALVLVAALAVDRGYNDWGVSLMLARKLLALIEWMAFWR